MMNKYQEAIAIRNAYIQTESGTKCLDDYYKEKFDTLQELVDKATPKKVIHKHKEYVFPSAYRLSGKCPNCKNHVDESTYCSKCGQKLDWSDADE